MEVHLARRASTVFSAFSGGPAGVGFFMAARRATGPLKDGLGARGSPAARRRRGGSSYAVLPGEVLAFISGDGASGDILAKLSRPRACVARYVACSPGPPICGGASPAAQSSRRNDDGHGAAIPPPPLHGKGAK